MSACSPSHLAAAAGGGQVEPALAATTPCSDNEDGLALSNEFRSISQAAVIRWHEQGRKQLSVGLELECFIPDIGECVRDRLVPVSEKKDLFALVAEEITRLLGKVDSAGRHRCRADHRVSADACDWGRLWTATADGSIQPRGSNPFPVELVSKRMRFEECDVTLFCDVVHALRSPPLRAATNESTGLHVHLGKYPSFFSMPEVASILKAYLRLEPVINSQLLPVTRQKNRFCQDLREVLARAAGFGESASDEALFAHIDGVVAFARSLPPSQRKAMVEGLRGATKRGELMSALLGEGSLWRNKVALVLHRDSEAGSAATTAPRGMVLQELWHRGRQVWRRPEATDLAALWGQDGLQGGADDELPTPWDALGHIDDEDDVEVVLRVPDDVPPDRFDHWLLRDGLILDRHGARYCKLNIMRIALPAEKATIEFRQFPGGNFSQTLIIWGWVKFLGLLVTHSCAASHGELGVALPAESTEAELKRFLQLSSDTMLVAWFRDVHNRLPQAEGTALAMRSSWEFLWRRWADVSQQSDVRSLASACELWRRIFQAGAGMRPIFPQTDAIWDQLVRHRKASEDFMQRLYRVLESRLRALVRQLRAAVEISGKTSLATTLQAVLEEGRLRRSWDEVRMLQRTITESRGWTLCDESALQRVGLLSQSATELTLDLARNLLEQCEGSAISLQGAAVEESEVGGGSAGSAPPHGHKALGAGGTTGAVQDAQHPHVAQQQQQQQQRGRGELIRLSARTGSAPFGVALQLPVDDDAAGAEPEHLRTLYHELCSWLLVPRADEAVDLWKGLKARDWTGSRVHQLNSRVFEASRLQAWAIAADRAAIDDRLALTLSRGMLQRKRRMSGGGQEDNTAVEGEGEETPRLRRSGGGGPGWGSATGPSIYAMTVKSVD